MQCSGCGYKQVIANESVINHCIATGGCDWRDGVRSHNNFFKSPVVYGAKKNFFGEGRKKCISLVARGVDGEKSTVGGTARDGCESLPIPEREKCARWKMDFGS